MTRTYSNTDPVRVRTFAIEAARLLADLKCTDVVLLDVAGHSQVCDYVLIGSGTSQRQMKSVAASVADLGDSMQMSAFRSNRDDGTTWIVVDFVEVVVHLFEPDQRLYYDLELMWSQAKRVDWKRDAAAGSSSGGTKRAKAAIAAEAEEDDEDAGLDSDDASDEPAAKKKKAKSTTTRKSAATKKTSTRRSSGGRSAE